VYIFDISTFVILRVIVPSW